MTSMPRTQQNNFCPNFSTHFSAQKTERLRVAPAGVNWVRLQCSETKYLRKKSRQQQPVFSARFSAAVQVQVFPWELRHGPFLRPCIDAWIPIVRVCEGIPSTSNHMVHLASHRAKYEAATGRTVVLESLFLGLVSMVPLFESCSSQATVKRSNIILKMLNKTCSKAHSTKLYKSQDQQQKCNAEFSGSRPWTLGH